MMGAKNLLVALLVLSSSAAILHSAPAAEPPDHINNHGPFHLSWRTDQIRWDFLFGLKEIGADVADLSDLIGASNSSTVAECNGQKACLFKDKQLIRTYKTSPSGRDKLVFSAQVDPTKIPADVSKRPSDTCIATIHNYCSTHWNPPSHVTGDDCHHSFEWHSPYSCTKSQTNYEIPCYVHDPSGKLIDLTHLVLSNGSSYEIDTGSFNKTINKFHLNVCNEASERCGPNTSSCRLDKTDTIETGFNNMTTIKYDSKENSVHLISLGQTDEKCADKRVKTVVKFRCPERFVNTSKPKLVQASDCESIIDWPTVRACPVPDVQAPTTKCGIKYEPLGIDIDLKKVFINQDLVTVSNITINGKNKSMMLGLCKGIDLSKYRCAGKSSKGTSACLIEEGSGPEKSEIVSSNSKSMIKLADSRLLIESFATNKTCEVPVMPSFNYTRRVGTRIEVVCSETNDLQPKFIGFEDCVYIFEWGSSNLCLENMISQPQVGKLTNTSTTAKPTITPLPSTSPVPLTNITNHDDPTPEPAPTKSAHDLHKDTVADSKKILEPEVKDDPAKISPQTIKHEPKTDNIKEQIVQQPAKMNKVHKFFMIGLIVMSLTAFVVVIFILDRKTNFKIPLGGIGRRARQALRPQPVPYTRVSFNENLDL